MNAATISRLESTPAAIVVTAPDEKIIYWNGRGEALFGYSSTDAVGQFLSEMIVPPSERKAEQEFLRKTLKTGAGSLECVRQRKNGSQVYVYVSSKVLSNRKEEMEFVLFSIKDMTRVRLLSDLEERELKFDHHPAGSDEQLRLFIENAEGYASCFLSPEGIIESWNIGAERVIGYGAEKIIGKHFSCFYPLELIGLGSPEWDLRTALAQGHSEDEGWRIREDGQQFWANILMTVLRHPDGLLKGFAMVVRDMTKQQQAEVMEFKNIALQNAAEAKDRFLANISHELRTPLHGIIGFAEFLSDGKPGTINLKQAEYLKDILTNGHHLLELVTDMLDVAKMPGELILCPEPFSLLQALEETCDALGPLAQAKGIHIDLNVVAGLGEVALDREKFKQIFTHLLSNAIKFNHIGGTVELHAKPHGTDHVKLVVCDSGIGIKEQDSERIFKKFEQAESGRTRRYEGTGLGLALTLKLVELQGGTIEVKSQAGKGSRFTVNLPLSARFV